MQAKRGDIIPLLSILFFSFPPIALLQGIWVHTELHLGYWSHFCLPSLGKRALTQLSVGLGGINP